MLFFLPDRVGVDRGGAELCVAEPALEHVQGNALNGRVDAEAMPEPLGRAVRRVGNAGLDHHALHDLPDPDPAQVPDGGGRPLAGFLGLPDAVGDVQSIEELSGDRDGPEHDLLLTRGVFAFLEGADGDGAAGEVDPRRRDL